MKMPPCQHDCPHRSIDPNCHTICKKYLDWRSDKDKENNAKYREMAETEYTIGAQKRMKRQRYHGKQR